MTLTRRSFLQSLTAAVAASSLPVVNAAGAASKDEFLRIDGEALILRKPIIIESHHRTLITNSRFIPADDFQGDTLFILKKGVRGATFRGCTFDTGPRNIAIMDIEYPPALLTGDGLLIDTCRG